MKRLPSLDALRAFEAAARHRSFTRAGEELHVTQSALSHRIAALEQELGRRLFRRVARRLDLTAEGERLAAGIARGLEEIRRALHQLDTAQPSGPLHVSVLPSFAARWLLPRLGRFRLRHPDIDVRIAGDAAPANLRAGAADIAIRFGRGDYPGLDTAHLMDDAVFPVASPLLLRGRQAIEVAELAGLPLLHDVPAATDGSGADWRSFFHHAGCHGVDCEAGLRFNQALLTLEAAAGGLGVALARRSLVEGDLASGRLVRLTEAMLPTQFAYYLVCLPETKMQPNIRAFADWIHEEASAVLPEARSARRQA